MHRIDPHNVTFVDAQKLGRVQSVFKRRKCAAHAKALRVTVHPTVVAISANKINAIDWQQIRPLIIVHEYAQ